MKQKVVEVGNFAEVLDGSYGEYGVKKGDIIYVAGDAITAVSEKDPYALRRIFVAAFLDDGHINTKKNPFTIDGKRLQPVSKGKQEKLDAIRKADFEDKVEADDSTN